MGFIRKWFRRLIIVGILLSILIAGSVIFGIISGDEILRNIQRVFNPAPRAAITSKATIITDIRLLGVLETTYITLNNPSVEVNLEQGFLNACGLSAKHDITGTVEAGVNLELVNDADLTYDEASNTYTLRLPHAQLTSCRIDMVSQYDRSTSTCGDFDLARELGTAQGIVLLRKQALQEGTILSLAEEKAASVLKERLVGMIGSSNLEISFTTTPVEGLPASCTASSPRGWRYDEATGTWTPPSS